MCAIIAVDTVNQRNSGQKMDNASKLRLLRISEGLNLVELSRLSGVSDKTLRGIEYGRTAGTLVTRHKILNGMNANPSKSRRWTYEDLFD